MKGVLKKVTKFNLTMMIMGAVLTCLMLFSNMTISHAKSDETDDKKVEYQGIYFKADYADTLTPMKGDTFTIKYSAVNIEDSPQAEITIDAYDIAENPQKLDFPKEYTYQVDQILYTGSNGGIFSYALPSTFNVHPEGEEDTLVISIGIEKAQKLYDKTPYVKAIGIVTDKMLAESGGKTYEDFETEYKDRERERKSLQEVETETNTGTTTNPQLTAEPKTDDVYTEEYGDNYGVEVQNPTGDQPSVEVYSTESTTESAKETKDDTSPMSKALVIVIVVVIAGALIIVLSKKNKTRR